VSAKTGTDFDAHLNLVYTCSANPEAVADELNPLTTSHTANTISFKAVGKNNNVEIVEEGSRPNIGNKPDAKYNGAPTRPQTDNHRGMSFD